MIRRDFSTLFISGSIGLALSPILKLSEIFDNCSSPFIRIPLHLDGAMKTISKDSSKIPFGWNAFGLEPEKNVLLHTKEIVKNAVTRLRISIAQEVWEELILTVSIAQTDIQIGEIDIRYSPALVPCELVIPSEYLPLICSNGLVLRLSKGTSTLYLFSSQQTDEKCGAAFFPHLLMAENEPGQLNDFLSRFLSYDSIQSFGWREGCVLDGLWQIYKRQKEPKAFDMLQKHLRMFFDREDNLIYEDAFNKRHTNHLDTIETTLPFAQIALMNPNHRCLKTAIEYWLMLKKDNNLIADGNSITAEGCYTIAYPMAMVASAYKDTDIRQLALDQLRHRKLLYRDGSFFLRFNNGKEYLYQNWARGAAWFLLGFVRTLTEIKDISGTDDLVQTYIRASQSVSNLQQKNGLWNCFMADSNGLPDTSGSAGIAAALATGVSAGMLPAKYMNISMKCWNALLNYLTPDGFLTGVAQDNRGGIDLQKGNYRVIAQMGMGLMAQLYAATN